MPHRQTDRDYGERNHYRQRTGSENVMTRTEPMHAVRFRAADVALAPAGSGMTVAYSRESGRVELLTPGLVRRLSGAPCSRTLGEPAGGAPGVRGELERLAAAGFLFAAPEPGEPWSPPPIACLAFPTADRV